MKLLFFNKSAHNSLTRSMLWWSTASLHINAWYLLSLFNWVRLETSLITQQHLHLHYIWRFISSTCSDQAIWIFTWWSHKRTGKHLNGFTLTLRCLDSLWSNISVEETWHKNQVKITNLNGWNIFWSRSLFGSASIRSSSPGW